MTELEKYIDENVPEYTPQELYKNFVKFSTAVKTHMNEAHSVRKNTVVKPTQIEYDLGTYVEDIEPQMRSAVLSLYKKGYDLVSWGTDGHESQVQSIRGRFSVAADIENKLGAMDVKTRDINFDGNQGTEIFFLPEKPQGKLMEEKWNQIADVFPENPQQKPFQRYTTAAESFRRNFDKLFSKQAQQLPDTGEKAIFSRMRNELQRKSA